MSAAEITKEFEAIEAGLLRFNGALTALLGSVPSKPLFGGPFGAGSYLLASKVASDQGLDAVVYMVLEARSRFALAIGLTKAEALAAARKTLKLHGVARLGALIARFEAENEAKRQAELAERRAALDLSTPDRKASPAAPKSIPKRRREIFDASSGKCHYCETTLTLDGKWHIEHKMPRALLGTNEPSNLVASCVGCNTKKRDKTDEEFFASRSVPSV